MPATAARKPKPAVRWAEIRLVHIYRYARAGMSDARVAESLGVSPVTLARWKRAKSSVREALALARAEAPPEDGFVKYFYSQLDPRLQSLWDQIENANNLGGGIRQLDNILADHGARARQSLFLHALISSHFSPTRAMEKVGIDKRQLDTWVSTDPDFADLVKEIQWHKQNFFEEALVKLVASGDTSAILFANRGLNRDRGYGKEETVRHHPSGSIEHRSVLDLSELELSQACRIEIAQAIRKRDEELEQRRLLGSAPAEDKMYRRVEAEIAAAATTTE